MACSGKGAVQPWAHIAARMDMPRHTVLYTGDGATCAHSMRFQFRLVITFLCKGLPYSSCILLPCVCAVFRRAEPGERGPPGRREPGRRPGAPHHQHPAGLSAHGQQVSGPGGATRSAGLPCTGPGCTAQLLASIRSVRCSWRGVVHYYCSLGALDAGLASQITAFPDGKRAYPYCSCHARLQKASGAVLWLPCTAKHPVDPTTRRSTCGPAQKRP